MKKLKYLITIIVVCIIVFIGIEVFRKIEHEEENKITNNTTENTNITTGEDTENILKENITTDTTNIAQQQNTTTSNNTPKIEEIKNGEELMQKSEKTLTARGWAGASNNVIGLKDGIIYYYNKATEEFYKIAEGIEDIYYITDDAEDITAKKKSNFKELKESPAFLIYK